MAAIDVGGDTSVMWKVDVDNSRPGKTKSEPRGGKGHHQEGIDETDAGEDFSVAIKIPANATAKANFVQALRKAADDADAATAGSGAKVSVSFPIEPQNENQIQIRWKSKP